MAYYENRNELLGGDLILYQRNLKTAAPNSKNHRQAKWYMKLRIGPHQTINRSTGLTNYEEAYSFARKEFDRLRNAVALGHTLDDFTFEKHWDDWYQRNLNNRTWAAERQRWHKNQAALYYKAYFRYADGKSMRLNDITPQFAQGYWDWRIAFWSTEQGEKRANYNPKRRKAKTQTAHNAVKVPSKKTLQMDQTALNQIFWDARERGRLQQVFKLKPPADSRPHNRRPHFEPAERQSMVAYLLSYRDVKGHFKKDRVNAWHKLQRAQLYHFVVFMLNSGLRVGEARRNKLIAAIDEQLHVADAALRGEEYTVTLSRWGKNETGEKVRVQRQKVVRSWFFAQDGGFYVQCKYGAKAISLSKDGNAIFVKQLADVKPVLETLRSATANGELDAYVAMAINSRKNSHKVA